jgi:hypothetical protein
MRPNTRTKINAYIYLDRKLVNRYQMKYYGLGGARKHKFTIIRQEILDFLNHKLTSLKKFQSTNKSFSLLTNVQSIV